MSGARPLLRALALWALAAAPALGWVREENPSLSGVCVAWPTAQRAVHFEVNASSYVGGCADPAAAAAAVRLAVQPWTAATREGAAAACTDVSFVDDGDTDRRTLGYDGHNLIVFRSGNCSDHAATDASCAASATMDACIEAHNCWWDANPGHGQSDGGVGVLALTTYTARGNKLVDTDIELYGWNGQTVAPEGFRFTCADPVLDAFGGLANLCPDPVSGEGCVNHDVRNTVTHEVGHLLGLNHSNDPQSTMAASAGRGETAKRVLHADDVDGICTLYPAGQETDACPLAQAAGCASGEGLGPLALLAVGLAPWLRRRRRR